MLIEFCCPACCTPLAVKDDVAGGQVNCPHCQKLILIPVSSPFGRLEGGGPFEAGRKHEVDAVKRAISISVEPYRRELEAKGNLLNEAVEMVKTRNRRIREIESLILKVQKDLWALEVEHEETGERPVLPATAASVAEQEELEELGAHCRELGEQVTKLQVRNEVMQERLGRALESLADTHAHLHEEKAVAAEMVLQMEALKGLVPGILEQIGLVEADTLSGPDLPNALRQAAHSLKRCGEEITSLRKELSEKALAVQGLITSDTGKTKAAQALEAALAQKESDKLALEAALASKEADKLALEAALASKAADKLALDADLASKDTDKQALEAALASKESELRELEASWTRKEEDWTREQKANETRRTRLREELTEQEEQLQNALKTQQTLAEQCLKMENERKDIKRRLTDALEKIVVLESRG